LRGFPLLLEQLTNFDIVADGVDEALFVFEKNAVVDDSFRFLFGLLLFY
jgi:hypothetical protein